MKNIKKIVWIVAIIAILIIVKLVFLSPKAENQKQGGQPGKMAPTAVTVFIVTPSELANKVVATGTLIANEEALLTPEISGKVVAIHIVEGSVVKKGELLVKLNDIDYQAQLSKIDLQLKINDEKINRQKQLLAIKGISQEEYDLSLNVFNSAKADMDYMQAQIAKTEIRAPFSGVIGLRYVSEGSFVTPTTRIASIQQLNPIKIDFSVPEKYADVIQKNDVIQFSIGEDNKTRFNARVYAIEPKIDMNTRTLQLRATADNSKGEFFPGSFAKIELPLRKIENALMVPTEAIIPILKGKKVFICKAAKAHEVNVETGIRTDAFIQIISGLQPGDSVITTGIMQLKQDNPVRVVKAISEKK